MVGMRGETPNSSAEKKLGEEDQMAKPNTRPDAQLDELKVRTEENEIRAKEIESQIRLIEARLKLMEIQKQHKAAAAAKREKDKSDDS